MKKDLTKQLAEMKAMTSSLSEIGPTLASKAISFRHDERGKLIHRDAVTSLFREFIGRSMPFYMKTRPDATPVQYSLIEVLYQPKSDIKPNDPVKHDGVFTMVFHSDATEGHPDPTAVYADEVKQFEFVYHIKADQADSPAFQYRYNMYAVNFILKAVAKIREMHFTAFPLEFLVQPNPYRTEKDPELKQREAAANEQMKKTRLTKQSFQMFSFDSGNLMNKSASLNESLEEMNQVATKMGLTNFLKEGFDGDFSDEDGEETTQPTHSGSDVQAMRPQLAAAAQQVYNGWDQDENGEDAMLGTGGICQDIADAMATVLIQQGVECTTASAQTGEQHVWVVAKLSDGVWEVDISPYTYETGGGYTWTKIPDVEFSERDVVVRCLSSDPNDFDQYVEY